MNTDLKEKVKNYVRKLYKSYDVPNLEVTKIPYGVRVLKEGKNPLYLSTRQLLNIN